MTHADVRMTMGPCFNGGEGSTFQKSERGQLVAEAIREALLK
jgi:hypothetical protein